MVHDAALELGLSCCYIGGVRLFANDLAQYLKIKGIATPVVGLTIGYAIRENHVRPKLNKVFDEKYDLKQLHKNIEEYNKTMANYYQERNNNQNSSDYIQTVTKYFEAFEKVSKKQNDHYHNLFKKIK